MVDKHNEIKYFIKKHDLLIKDIATDVLNMSPQAFQNKMSKDTIRYSEVKKIANFLGYDIIWKKKS